LSLAEALGVDGKTLDDWLVAAGFAPMPLLRRVRGAVRTRGGIHRPRGGTAPSERDATLWERLEAIGLGEARIRRLLQAAETASFTDRQKAAEAVSRTFSVVAEALETPVHTAVIPAAGGQHRFLAGHVMQRVLLRAIREAAESGITNITLVLAPGAVDALYLPLKESLELSVVPPIQLQCAEQRSPEGLGDAILCAEALVGKEAFAVLLPDDFVHNRTSRGAKSRALRLMMDAFGQLDSASFLAVKPMAKSRMPYCGVARVGTEKIIPGILPVEKLVEKPEGTHPICRHERAFGIVGRYVLQQEVFRALKDLKHRGHGRLELSDALESLRQEGHQIYAFELKAKREDIGEVLEHAREIIAGS
jgi:UTP--glucose-1-phosphate uridylyltransferase